MNAGIQSSLGTTLHKDIKIICLETMVCHQVDIISMVNYRQVCDDFYS